MNMKKIISALAAAVMTVPMAAAVNAQEITLTYSNGTEVLNGFEYSTTDADGKTYELSEDGKNAIKNAVEGDTVTITYNIESNGTARYRNGLKIAGAQFFVNCGDTTKTDGSAFVPDNNRYWCHLNGDFKKNASANVSYVITLGEGGKIKSIAPSLIIGGTTIGWNIADGSKYNSNKYTVNFTDLNSIVLNAIVRSTTGSFDNEYAKLTNFNAVLNTSYEAPTQAIAEADRYTYENDPNLAHADAVGFTARIDGSEDHVINSIQWYLKETSDSEYKELIGGDLPNISGAGEYTVGLIVYNLPDGVNGDELSAGYTCGSTGATE